MGQNPVNPRPDLPQQPQSGPSGPSAPSYGQPGGPGYGHQVPQMPPPGPQPPQQGPGYPMPGQQPVQPGPYGQQGPSLYGPPPGGARPGSGYPYPAQPYGTPGRPVPKKKGKGLLVGLIVGAAALILVVAAGVAYVVTTQNAPVSTEPGKATKATAALQGYLEALAAGDADKAKLYAMNAPGDSPFLTSDFLKAEVAKNPVTEIQVDAQKDIGTTAYLSASYKLGGTLVQGNFQLTKVAKIWKLNSVATTVDRPSSWGNLGITVNGTAAAASQLILFPGVYQLATGTTLLSFDQSTFTVKDPDDYVSALASSQPALTDAGKKLMLSQSQAWLTQCLAVQDTNPKDCGMNTPLPDGATLAPGTLKRTVDSGTAPFADATPRISYDDPTKITMSGYVSIKVTAADTVGNTYSGSTSVTDAEGTISGDTITVVFTD